MKKRAQKMLRCSALTGLILAATLLISLFLQEFIPVDALVPSLFILAVFVVALVTDGYAYGIAASLISVLCVNYAFTAPYLTFSLTLPENLVSALIMLAVTISTSTLTVQRRRQAEIRNETARETMRANLLRAISHDLRTPLTSISGNAANLLANDAKLDEDARHQIFLDIYDDSMWLINLVENLLSITRIEDGRMNLRLSTELVSEVIEEALRHTHRKGSEHTIRMDLPDELLLARMDARLIVQVLINLVDNAVKYTPAGSTITVTARAQDGFAAISVLDDGPGIAPDIRPHIFEMFYTGEHKVADSRRSLGLGLALCKTVVDAHGGTITLTDNPPHGCNFTFTVPRGEVTLHE